MFKNLKIISDVKVEYPNENLSINELIFISIMSISRSDSRKYDYKYDDAKKCFVYDLHYECSNIDDIMKRYEEYKKKNNNGRRNTFPAKNKKKIFLKRSQSENIDNTCYAKIDSNSD